MEQREYLKLIWGKAKPHLLTFKDWIFAGSAKGDPFLYEVYRKKRLIIIQNFLLFVLIIFAVIVMQSQAMVMGLGLMLIAGWWTVRNFLQFQPKFIRTTKEACAGYAITLIVLKIVCNHIVNATPENLKAFLGGSEIAPTGMKVAQAWLPTMIVLIMLLGPFAFITACLRQHKLHYTRERSEDMIGEYMRLGERSQEEMLPHDYDRYLEEHKWMNIR